MNKLQKLAEIVQSHEDQLHNIEERIEKIWGSLESMAESIDRAAAIATQRVNFKHDDLEREITYLKDEIRRLEDTITDLKRSQERGW